MFDKFIKHTFNNFCIKIVCNIKNLKITNILGYDQTATLTNAMDDYNGAWPSRADFCLWAREAFGNRMTMDFNLKYNDLAWGNLNKI